MTIHKAGGLRLDLTDKKVLLGAQAAAPSLPPLDIASLPETGNYRVHHRKELQGRQNSCGGHAASAALERAYWNQTKGKSRQYNREVPYLLAQRVDGIDGDRGCSIQGLCKAVTDAGIPTEEIWGYTGEYPPGGWRAIPAPVLAEAKKTVLGSYRVLNSYEEVLQWLSLGIGGCICGIHWNSSCEPDADNELKTYHDGPMDGEQDVSGHALGLLDWSKKRLNPRKLPAIWMANWHPDYGDEFGGVWVHAGIINHFCTAHEVVGFADVKGDIADPIRPKEMRWAAGFSG